MARAKASGQVQVYTFKVSKKRAGRPPLQSTRVSACAPLCIGLPNQACKAPWISATACLAHPTQGTHTPKPSRPHRHQNPKFNKCIAAHELHKMQMNVKAALKVHPIILTGLIPCCRILASAPMTMPNVRSGRSVESARRIERTWWWASWTPAAVGG